MIKLTPEQKTGLFNIVRWSGPTKEWWECELRIALKKVSPLFQNPTTADIINGFLMSCGFILDDIFTIKEVKGEDRIDRNFLAREIKAMVYHAGCETNEEFIELFNEEVLPLIKAL